MSYILKALRKAEQERRAAPAASAEDFLNHSQTNPAVAPARGKNFAILILSTLLVLCGGYLAVNLTPDEPATATAQPAPVPLEPVDMMVESPPAPPVSAPPQPTPQLAEPPPPAPEPAAVPAAQQPLPPINITGYIYFEDDPARSKLFVDGIVYRLGSRLPGGQVIASFGEDEVTLFWQDGEQRLSVR